MLSPSYLVSSQRFEAEDGEDEGCDEEEAPEGGRFVEEDDADDDGAGQRAVCDDAQAAVCLSPEIEPCARDMLPSEAVVWLAVGLICAAGACHEQRASGSS